MLSLHTINAYFIGFMLSVLCLSPIGISEAYATEKNENHHHSAKNKKDTIKSVSQKQAAQKEDDEEEEEDTPKKVNKRKSPVKAVQRHANQTQKNTAETTSVSHATPRQRVLRVNANKAMVIHEETGQILFSKNSDQVSPIASVTKLMTAMVVLDRNLPMDEEITIVDDDVDYLKHSSSRLQVGTTFTRREALQLALMSSENRAAASLGRTYPGGTQTFVAAMNRKAQELNMTNSHFSDPTGLNSANVSTAEDLVKMVRAAHHYETIREITTTTSYELGVGTYKRPTLFNNTNRLVREGEWDVGVSKTGYISEAGHCLVMQTNINGTPIILVLLDNWGKYSCQADAVRIRQWFERQSPSN